MCARLFSLPLLFVIAFGAVYASAIESSAAGQFIPPAEGLWPGREAQCGPRALYGAIKLLDGTPDYLGIVTESQADEEGTSFDGLLKATRTNGVQGLALEVSESDLNALLIHFPRRIAVICHVKSPDHFVLLYRDSQGNVIKFDPNQPAEFAVSDKAFLVGYSGAALIVSNDEVNLEEVQQCINRSKSSGLAGWGVMAVLCFVSFWSTVILCQEKGSTLKPCPVKEPATA